MSASSMDSAGGRRDLVAQPDDGEREGPVAQAEAEVAQISESDQPLGEIGRRFDRKSPFLIGMAAAAGVPVIYGLVLVVVGLRRC